MRRVALLVLAPTLVLGCSKEQDDAAPRLAAAGSAHIGCALDGASEFTPACAVDRVELDGKLTLIVRHPDGAFRRFTVVNDGRGMVVADGAEEAVTSVESNKLAVGVGDDRYLFPARIKPGTLPTAPDGNP